MSERCLDWHSEHSKNKNTHAFDSADAIAASGAEFRRPSARAGLYARFRVDMTEDTRTGGGAQLVRRR